MRKLPGELTYSAEFVESFFRAFPMLICEESPVVDNYPESRPFGVLEGLFLQAKRTLPLIVGISDIDKISDFSLIPASASLSGLPNGCPHFPEITVSRSARQKYVKTCNQGNNPGPSPLGIGC